MKDNVTIEFDEGFVVEFLVEYDLDDFDISVVNMVNENEGWENVKKEDLNYGGRLYGWAKEHVEEYLQKEADKQREYMLDNY